MSGRGKRSEREMEQFAILCSKRDRDAGRDIERMRQGEPEG